MRSETETISRDGSFSPEKTAVLGDGITLHYLPMPAGRFKTGRLSLYFLSQMGDGRQAEAALLPAVLSLGCKPYPSLRKINRALEALYDPSLDCRVSRRGEIRVTEFRLSFLEGRNLPETALPRGEFFDQITESALDLLFSLLLAPCARSREGKRLLRSDFVSKEKKNLLAALRAERNDREAYAKRRCTELLCAGEPYAGSDLGEEKAVRAANAGTLTAYYQSLLESQPLEIYYTGSEPMDALCAYLRAKLSSLLSCHRTPLPTLSFSDGGGQTSPVWVDEKEDLLQGRLVIGCLLSGNMTGEDLPAFLLFREILSSSPIAKLFRFVREKEGLCYDCYAVGDILKGVLFLCAGVDGGKGKKAEGAILAQLAAMQKGEIDGEELACGKKSLCCALRELSDSPAASVSFSLRETLLFGAEAPHRTPAALIDRIPHLTQEDVTGIALRVFPKISYFLHGDGDGAEFRDEKSSPKGACAVGSI